MELSIQQKAAASVAGSKRRRPAADAASLESRLSHPTEEPSVKKSATSKQKRPGAADAASAVAMAVEASFVVDKVAAAGESGEDDDADVLGPYSYLASEERTGAPAAVPSAAAAAAAGQSADNGEKGWAFHEGLTGPLICRLLIPAMETTMPHK